MRRNRIPVVKAVWAVIAAILFMIGPRASAQERVLHNFNGNGVDGAYPEGALVSDAAGNLYGATTAGGPGGNGGCGVVFELTFAGGAWAENILHTFTGGADGCQPANVGLIFDARGNLYGTTSGGGAYNNGTAFKLAAPVAGVWKETILHNFGNGLDGSFPDSNLTLDAAGNLYGTTQGNAGTVFELLPQRAGNWIEHILSSSCNCGASGLIFDRGGNLYTYGSGGILELKPSGGGNWTGTVVFTFPNAGNQGLEPFGNLIFDAAGNLYGTTLVGGTSCCPGWGVVFKLTPMGGGQWAETVLYNFQGAAFGDGGYPYAGVIFDAYGNIFGTTSQGGVHQCCGTVFELTPAGGGKWAEHLLYSFGAFPGDASGPYDSLIMVGGNLYGTAYFGGANNVGAVFEIIR